MLPSLFQSYFQLLKLSVDVNPYSLKGTGCRIFALFKSLDCPCHDLCKLLRTINGLPGPASNNLLCNLKSKPFFPILMNHLRNFFLTLDSEPFPRRHAS